MLKKLLILCMGFIVLGLGAVYVVKYMPKSKQVDPLTYFDEFREGQSNMVFEDERLAYFEPILEENNRIYVSSEVARDYIDKTIFYDETEQILTITNAQEVIRLIPNETMMKVNDEEIELKDPIIEREGKAYLPESFLETYYDIEVSKGRDGRLYMASYTDEAKQLAKVKKRGAKLRTHADSQSLVIDEVEKGHELIVYEEGDKYSRVRNENGIIGYISNRAIKMTTQTEPTHRRTYYEALPSKKEIQGKVKMIWDQMTVPITGDWNSTKYQRLKNANVISPTWFEFADENGNLNNRAVKAYVENAHKMGLQVWPLISHNFLKPSYTKSILTSTNKRQSVIDQLLEAADQYGFDGINIDIENIQPEFSQEWVQFMRELYPQAKQKGLTVSVDVYMPSAWSKHYERAEISEVVDYFIVMAYDQHWSGSEVAGPVAGLDWVEAGLIANLEEVPKEKLILGMPFFNRVWEEKNNELGSKTYGIYGAETLVRQWGVTPTYDEVTGLDYAEYTKEDRIYKVWLENSNSIAKRIELMEKYDLAGYAGWKLGLETDEIWNVLEQVE